MRRLLAPTIWLLVLALGVLPAASEAGVRICRFSDGAFAVSVGAQEKADKSRCPRRSAAAAPLAGDRSEQIPQLDAGTLPVWSTCLTAPCLSDGAAETAWQSAPQVPHRLQGALIAILPLPSELPGLGGSRMAWSTAPPPTPALSPLLRSIVLLI